RWRVRAGLAWGSRHALGLAFGGASLHWLWLVQEQPRGALADDLAAEALPRRLHLPGRVAGAVALLDAQEVGMLVCVVQRRQAGVVGAGEQVARHDGLGRLI